MFIALCAVALTLETSAVAGIPSERVGFYLFIFLATLTSYRLHSHVQLDRQNRWTLPQAFNMLITFFAGVGACLTAPNVGSDRLAWVVIAGILAWLYSVPMAPGARRLREFGVAKIFALAGVWTLITSALPLLGKVDGWTIALLTCRRFLFMFVLCLAFDLRDAASDMKRSVRTLPVRLGVERTHRLMRMTLMAFAMMSVIIPYGQAPRVGFGIAAALTASAVVTAAVIEATRRHRSPLLFVGGVDGMMLLQCLLVWCASA